VERKRVFLFHKDGKICSHLNSDPHRLLHGPKYTFKNSLSLVSTIGELLERSSGSVLEIRKYGRRDLSRWSRDTQYPQKLALTSPKSGGRSVPVVRSRTETTESVTSLFKTSSQLFLYVFFSEKPDYLIVKQSMMQRLNCRTIKFRSRGCSNVMQYE
jgi:hypothetical protein